MAWIVSQFGARQHYATPRAFHRQGKLDIFYTENWAGRLRPLLLKMPGRFRAFGNRWSPDLPNNKVASFDITTLYDILTRSRRHVSDSIENVHAEYIREGVRFCSRVNRHLRWHRRRLPLDPAREVFYGCKSVCLETLQLMNEKGIFSIVDQADPAAVEEKIVQAEREKWYGWEAITGKVPASYYERCRKEWEAASVVLVYSDWTKQAIVEQGVAPEKVVVVPLAYEPPADLSPLDSRPVRDRNQPLTVLWLGSVMLRKGIPYLFQAAQLLADRPIKFVVAGPLLISEIAKASAPPNVEFIGRVIRGEAEKVYRSADIFVLPTLSDSFALTQVEAMANGLPVIATPRCGQVVTPGVDGYIVPTSSGEALAKAIVELDEDREKLAAMSNAALIKSKDFSIDAYAQRVRDIVVQRRPELAEAI
jgi:glycosyltransferase involved in cell wall biosynthesis